MKSKGQISVELQQWMGSDQMIAEAAWTSSLDYQKKQLRTEQDVKRVVNLLATSKHSVPFESVVLRFWIKLPIQTDRQHMTHRVASHSGMSGRYRTMPNEWLAIPEDLKSFVPPEYCSEYEILCDKANTFYLSWLNGLKHNKEAGYITDQQYKRAREFLRGVLPQNNMTERVTIMNLRSFANYYRLRSKSDAQLEIQTIAELMLSELMDKKVCPIAIDSLIRNDWVI